MLDRRDDKALQRFFTLATAKRPAEELYDLRADPAQLNNLAADPARRDAKARLRTMLDEWMRTTDDPRSESDLSRRSPAKADADRWDRYPYYGEPAKP
jgi:arylsulfatase A-like enzyme